MNGYWVVHLKSSGTVSESVLDFNKKATILEAEDEEWTFKRSCSHSTIAVIPRENILYVEWIDK